MKNCLSGASSGIGQGIATEYAKYGPFLALTGRSMERLQETKKLCMENGLDESKVVSLKVFVIKLSFFCSL